MTDIAERLGNNPNVKGQIKIFTELPPCNSCSNVLKQFIEKYPKTTIEVIHNSGKRIKN